MWNRLSIVTIAVAAIALAAFTNTKSKLQEKTLPEQLMDRIKAIPNHGDKPFGLAVRFKVKADQVETMLGAIKKAVPPTLKEEGCAAYEFLQDLEEPTMFYLLEKWKNPAGLESHFKSAHFGEFAGLLGPMLEEPPQIKLTAVVPTK